MEIAVIGLGYLGLTHAVAMCQLGHNVVGYDVDLQKIELANLGESVFFEPGLTNNLQQAIAEGLFVARSEPAVGDTFDIIFLCVGTPAKASSGEADLSQLFSAVDLIQPLLTEATVVVGKSTVPAGTAMKLSSLLRKIAGHEVPLAWNPEFLREGSALKDSLEPDRLIIGADSPRASQALRTCYDRLIAANIPVIEMSLNSAELVKLASNAFLATKISFINAISEIAEVSGADGLQVAHALGMDKRIGSSYLQPGLGYGGGCLPKDIMGFRMFANSIGKADTLEFLENVQEINLRARQRLIQLVLSEFESIEDRKVLVMGISFKPNTDDIRESPSLAVALQLRELGARVVVHDPVSLHALEKRAIDLVSESNLEKAAEGQEVLVVGTDWDLYRDADPQKLGKVVARKTIIDGRNILDVGRWRAAGWIVKTLGRHE